MPANSDRKDARLHLCKTIVQVLVLFVYYHAKFHKCWKEVVGNASVWKVRLWVDLVGECKLRPSSTSYSQVLVPRQGWWAGISTWRKLFRTMWYRKCSSVCVTLTKYGWQEVWPSRENAVHASKHPGSFRTLPTFITDVVGALSINCHGTELVTKVTGLPCTIRCTYTLVSYF